jgi:organic radical activating enzyme
MKYPVAERFKAPQGEGMYAGAQMAFIRLVGCSVGKGICHACDTDFDRTYPDLGGGLYTVEELNAWVTATSERRVCITGGEPLDRDLRPLLRLEASVHVETSGTVHPNWLDPVKDPVRLLGQHAVGYVMPDTTPDGDHRIAWRWMELWITVSPKPGYREEMVANVADEIKVILGGLGDGDGWPTVDDALRWAASGKVVYVQPRNERNEVDRTNLAHALEVVAQHPQLRLSPQIHKFVRTR